MPAEVKILIQGDTSLDSVAEAASEHTRPTITLVRDGDIAMVVDPGILGSQQELVDALAVEDLKVGDVDMVCITHSHLDHYRNIGMFPNAKSLDYYGLWDGTTVVTWVENLSKNIKVLHTPGHDYTCITIFVTTDDGVVAICGDVFWKENYPQDPYEDVYASNPEKLRESRETVVKHADWIIPGHGPMYKNIRAADFGDVTAPMKSKTGSVKVTVACKRCGTQMNQKDKCRCRPYMCFRCCECGMDCDLCNCSHRR